MNFTIRAALISVVVAAYSSSVPLLSFANDTGSDSQSTSSHKQGPPPSCRFPDCRPPEKQRPTQQGSTHQSPPTQCPQPVPLPVPPGPTQPVPGPTLPAPMPPPEAKICKLAMAQLNYFVESGIANMISFTAGYSNSNAQNCSVILGFETKEKLLEYVQMRIDKGLDPTHETVGGSGPNAKPSKVTEVFVEMMVIGEIDASKNPAPKPLPL